jgi:hypothetical protein
VCIKLYRTICMCMYMYNMHTYVACMQILWPMEYIYAQVCMHSLYLSTNTLAGMCIDREAVTCY